jgi:hypothetical protein
MGEGFPTAVGSGTCVEIGGRHFVATVAHNLDDVELTQLGVVGLGLTGKTYEGTPRLVGWV